jgi:hypothetical protein
VWIEFYAMISSIKMRIKQRKMKLLDAFRLFDYNHDGMLSCSELYGGLEWLGMKLTSESIKNMCEGGGEKGEEERRRERRRGEGRGGGEGKGRRDRRERREGRKERGREGEGGAGECRDRRLTRFTRYLQDCTVRRQAQGRQDSLFRFRGHLPRSRRGIRNRPGLGRRNRVF